MRRGRILGAVIAGGRSRRFGSDKALAQVGGAMLLDHIVAALRPQVDELIICGRHWPRLRSVPDRPCSDLGPLGGISAALHDARMRGFDRVLTAPVDIFPFPADLSALTISQSARIFSGQYLVGIWPTTFADRLDRHIAAGHRSLKSWIIASGAVSVDDGKWGMTNINYRSDLHAATFAIGLIDRLDASFRSPYPPA